MNITTSEKPPAEVKTSTRVATILSYSSSLSYLIMYTDSKQYDSLTVPT